MPDKPESDLPPSPTDSASGTSSGPATGPLSEAMSDKSPGNSTNGENSHSKKSLKDKLVREVVEVTIVISYLAVCFSILETFRSATLLVKCSENDFLAGYATAGISALMLGKFVFMLENARFMNRFSNSPLAYQVLYRSIVFTVLMNFILNAEDRILHRPPDGYLTLHDPVKFWTCYFAHQLCFFIVFLLFFCIRGIGNALGEGKLFRLFFIDSKALSSR